MKISVFFLIFLLSLRLICRDSFYDLRYLGLKEGEAEVSFQITGETAVTELQAESCGLAHRIVPFKLKCRSVYSLKTSRTTEYLQIAKYRNLTENVLVREQDGQYSIYLLVDHESRLIQKYSNLITELPDFEQYTALKINTYILPGRTDDPLSLLSTLSKMNEKTTGKFQVITGLKTALIEAQSTDAGDVYWIQSVLDIPGVFPSGTTGKLIIRKKENTVFGIDLNTPGIGVFRIRPR